MQSSSPSPPSQAPNGPIRHEDFWFEDGNIVLSVTEDGAEHHFRVHRAILTIASPVFCDMISMPQPSAACESTLVSLRDDSVQDLTALLGFLYISRKALIVTFDVALAILRLSHKYQMEGLQQTMTLKLQEDWPLNHSAYLARLEYLGSPGLRLPEALKLIETAQRCQVSKLLPTAFFELACAWGTQWQDIIGKISPENAARLWVGRIRSEQRLRSFVYGFSKGSSPMMWKHSPPETITQHRTHFGSCSGHYSKPLICPKLSPQIRTELAENLFRGLYGFRALYRLTDVDLGICTGCQDWFKSILANKIRELWESIPADFDLAEVDSELYPESHS